MGTDPNHYRGYCGVKGNYDIGGAFQFELLTNLGLRESHYVLDIGCGSLRGGRLFIVYLRPGHYYGFDPNFWLVEDAIEKELGQEFIKLRQPTLDDEGSFRCSKFDQDFDYILAASVLSHASLEQVDTCLLEVSKCLKPRGIFAASMHVDGKKTYKDGWAWPHCSHHYLPDIKSIVDRVGLEMDIQYGIPSRSHQTWVFFRNRS